MKHDRDRPPRCERCWRRHRDWRRFALCNFSPVIWCIGTGPWASISDCPIFGDGRYRGGRTIICHPTEAEALDAKALIDRLACGGSCRRMHRVIDLRLLSRPGVPAA